jgi:hypothetical protein
MPLSSIVVIVIRLFALNWLLTAIPLLLSAEATSPPDGRNGVPLLMLYVPSVVLVILAAVCWILAPAVARLVSRGVDSTVNIGGLSRSDLYHFAFVFLGLFFILSSFADVINWLHYFTLSHEGSRHDARIQNLYRLTRPCITLALGLVSLLGALRWTEKLVAYDNKTHAT